MPQNENCFHDHKMSGTCAARLGAAAGVYTACGARDACGAATTGGSGSGKQSAAHAALIEREPSPEMLSAASGVAAQSSELSVVVTSLMAQNASSKKATSARARAWGRSSGG
jgi:hypothetical protein